MKKFLAAFLSVMIVMCASVTAFGATKSDVNKVVNTSVAYAFDGKYSQGGYTTANAKNFYILTKSGADVSAYKEAFFASAKDAAAAGTLTDLGTLGEIITIADMLKCLKMRIPQTAASAHTTIFLRQRQQAHTDLQTRQMLFAIK